MNRDELELAFWMKDNTSVSCAESVFFPRVDLLRWTCKSGAPEELQSRYFPEPHIPNVWLGMGLAAGLG